MLHIALVCIPYRNLPAGHLYILKLQEQGRSVAGSSATSFPHPNNGLCIDGSHLLQFTHILCRCCGLD
jgi:hypothetical protein